MSAINQEAWLVAPIPLDEAPDVTDFLTALGLGTLRADDVRSFRGRNDSWAGGTSAGLPVFVKRLPKRKVERVSVMGRLLDGQTGVRTPRFLGADPGAGLVAYTLLDDAMNGAELGIDGFTWDLAHAAGLLLGRLHAIASPQEIVEDPMAPSSPPMDALEALPLETYTASSGAELGAWALLHGDDAVVDAVTGLVAREHASVLVHGDLRLDQFLLYDGLLYLTDWEEAGYRDAARDIGAFAGEWLHRGVFGMAGQDEDAAPQEIISAGARHFEVLRPNVEAFWSGYLQARPQARDDAELAERSTAFAGWHLFDRLFASGHQRARLAPISLAAAGVGRKILLQPGDFVGTLGLGGDR